MSAALVSKILEFFLGERITIISVPEEGVGLSAYCIPKNGRAHTKTFLDSFWIPSPNNPGRAARFYGRENLKHVSWHPGRKIAYDNLIPGFGR